MTQIDEFESLFKSADKPVFHISELKLEKILVVTDDNVQDLDGYLAKLREFLSVLESPEHKLEFAVLEHRDYSSVQELLGKVSETCPDLICTYRNLHIPIEEHPFSLGVYIDVLTQATQFPILLLPRPDELLANDGPHLPNHVMAVTDHLAGDAQLVSYATRFTQPKGTLSLVHIEDEDVYNRYISTIGKIPALDTDVAKTEIKAKLLQEPTDYIESCRAEIEKMELPISVNSIVTLGHWLGDYKKLIEAEGIDLLVIHTKDDDQLAMHGMGYPLSIEIQHIPLLMI